VVSAGLQPRVVLVWFEVTPWLSSGDPLLQRYPIRDGDCQRIEVFVGLRQTLRFLASTRIDLVGQQPARFLAPFACLRKRHLGVTAADTADTPLDTPHLRVAVNPTWWTLIDVDLRDKFRIRSGKRGVSCMREIAK